MSIEHTAQPRLKRGSKAGRSIRPNSARMPGLRHERERRALSIGQLAQLSGVNWVTIKAAESGEKVAFGTIEKLTRALELNPPRPVMLALLGEGSND